MKSFILILLLGLDYGNTLPNLQEIPEAPRLPDLDYNSLPEFVRKYLPTEKPLSSIEANHARSKGNEKSDPKTYGMKLNNGEGFIWNDLLPERMSYHVGDNEATSEEHGKDLDDIIDDWVNKIENHTPNSEDTTKANDITSVYKTTSTQTEKYFKTTETPKTTAKPEKETNEKELLNAIRSKLDGVIIKDLNNVIKVTHKTGTEDRMNDTANENAKGDNKTKEFSAPNFGKDLAKANVTNITARTEQQPELPYILELLIQNDELWQWLSDSIAKYLEILIGRIGAVVQEEVDLLLQEYFENHDCGCKAKNNSRHDVKGNDKEQSDLSKKENNQKNSTSLAKLFLNPENLDTEKNDTEINEGVANSISKNDTVDDNISKHKKDKHPEPNKGDNKAEEQKSHEKTIIYGNSVGNERVTNVFIFHMNSESKPSISSNNSSGSYIIDFNTDPTNVNDKNKPNQENAQAETVSTESTKVPIDLKENDKETTECPTEEVNVSEETEETTQIIVEGNEDASKEATAIAITTEKQVELEDDEDNASKDEEKESTDVPNDETKEVTDEITTENVTEATSAEEAEE